MAPIRGASMPAKPSTSAFGRNKRPYVRKETEPTAVVFPTSPPQLSEYAFNIHGWALEDGIKDRGVFEVINAYNCTMLKGGFAAKIEEFKAGNQTDIYRTDMQYTARELDTTLHERDTAVAQYLVVGYTFQEDDPVFEKNKNFSRYSDNELVGESPPSEQNLIKWDSCRTPILVVTPVKDNTGTSVRLFGLVKPTSDLCQPVLLTHERIFYRWEFRASAGAKSTQRNKNWNQLVVAKARQLTPLTSIDTTSAAGDNGDNRGNVTIKSRAKRSKTVHKKEADDANIYSIQEALEPESIKGNILELYLDFASVLKPQSRFDRSLAASLLESGILSKINLILCEAAREPVVHIKGSKTDLVFQDLHIAFTKVTMASRIPDDRSIGLIQHFSNLPRLQTLFDVGEAEIVAKEIRVLWPRFGSLIQPWKLLRIKEVMLINDMGVGLEHMEEFFKNAFAFLKFNEQANDFTLSVKLVEFYQTAVVLCDAHNAEVENRQYYPTTDAMYLIYLLRDILEFDKFQNSAMSRDYARTRLPFPPEFNQGVFEYNFAFDLVEAYNQLPLTVNEIMDMAKEKNCDLDDVMLWLERIRSYIRQA